MEAGVGLETNAADMRVQFLQAARDAHESAACTQPSDKMSDAPAGLFPNLNGGPGIVRFGIGRVSILVGIKISTWVGLINFTHTADGAVGAFVTRCIDDVHTVSLEDALSFR